MDLRVPHGIFLCSKTTTITGWLPRQARYRDGGNSDRDDGRKSIDIDQWHSYSYNRVRGNASLFSCFQCRPPTNKPIRVIMLNSLPFYPMIQYYRDKLRQASTSSDTLLACTAFYVYSSHAGNFLSQAQESSGALETITME